MANQIALTKKQAIRAVLYLGELEQIIGEQLWDDHHPFGAQGKRELNRLKNSISKKVKRPTPRALDWLRRLLNCLGRHNMPTSNANR